MDNTVIISLAAAVIIIGGLIWWFFGGSAAEGGPKSKEDIAKLLTQQGYQVKDVDFDDGVYEVEAYKDGKEFEIKLDRTGKILKIKEDD